MEISIIQHHIDEVNESIKWVSSHLEGQRREKAYDHLVEKRRALKRVKLALENNPAAVLYGISQQGKSYLASALLSSAKGRFKVMGDTPGEEYDFILDINPSGGGKESTSLITRFTTKKVSDIVGFPVFVRLLSLPDFILSLSDSYFEDMSIRNDFFKSSVLDEMLTAFEEKVLPQPAANIMDEDDVMDIMDYFDAHLHNAEFGLMQDANFFKRVSRVISKANSADIIEIFSILWNRNELFTKLFRLILQQYEAIHFAKEVYAPYTAILRESHSKHGAEILNVSRLENIRLGAGDPSADKPVAVKYRMGNVMCDATIDAANLCAMATEVVLQLPEEASNDKPFLKQMDILDFPGARGRLGKAESQIVGNTDFVKDFLLRGKVAYFFNKYADNYMISTLLLCHGDKQTECRYMPHLLRNWISKAIGKTPEERQQYLNTSKVSPLFAVCTMFNKDLAKDQNDRPGSDSFDKRWNKRFDNIFVKELFGVENQWLNNWTTATPSFDNFYLLRDFYFSSDIDGECSMLFHGWTKDGGEEKDEIPIEGWNSFREDMKSSFVNYDFVKKHFHDPALDWDAAASKKCDGSKHIISQLSIVGENTAASREEKFRRELNEIKQQVVEELSAFYHDGNADAELQKAKAAAGRLQADLDFVFGTNPYSFGRIMQLLIVKEGDVYNVFHRLLHSDKLVEGGGLDEYTFIRKKVQGLNKDNSFDENLRLLAAAYNMDPIECKAFWERRNVSLTKLFSMKENGMKSSSETLVDALFEYWYEDCLKKNRKEQLAKFIDGANLEEMLEMYNILYQKLNMPTIIANAIRPYADHGAISDDMEYFIADACAELLNQFITSVGYDFFTSSIVEKLEESNVSQHLDLDLNFVNGDSQGDNPDLVRIFDVMDDMDSLRQSVSSNDQLQILPGIDQRRRWSELLKVGFVETAGVPNYDVAANKLLGVIIDECKSINY